uniref:Uncharacterized protein n=1 Tax=Anguilla anguilla TaxID=7936 RepID=A0A0E9SHW3_ANGAN
MIRKVVQLYSF